MQNSRKRNRQSVRSNRRKKKNKFNHAEGLYAINRDFLGPTRIYLDDGFKSYFRISKARFERLRTDIANADIKFFKCNADATKTIGASIEAKLLLPLKTFAFGVSPHALLLSLFSDVQTTCRRVLQTVLLCCLSNLCQGVFASSNLA